MLARLAPFGSCRPLVGISHALGVAPDPGGASFLMHRDREGRADANSDATRGPTHAHASVP
jgi:hypothetical protein